MNRSAEDARTAPQAGDEKTVTLPDGVQLTFRVQRVLPERLWPGEVGAVCTNEAMRHENGRLHQVAWSLSYWASGEATWRANA